jgi:hypothetical protein
MLPLLIGDVLHDALVIIPLVLFVLSQFVIGIDDKEDFFLGDKRSPILKNFLSQHKSFFRIFIFLFAY